MTRFASGRVVGLIAIGALVAACGGGAASPTAAPAKPAVEATKPADASKPAPAVSPAAAQPTTASQPATAASPATKPAPAAGSPVAAPATLPPPTPLNNLTGSVAVDGSSTVFPVSEAMAEEFQKATGGRVRVTVGISGTGGGFKKFCAGETDISDASRPIQKAEMDACKEAGIQFVEVPVAFDGLSIVASQRNTFVDCMTVSDLKKMWQPEAQGTVTRWNQIRPEWPDRAFKLYGAGTDSGTFDYFTDAINGREKASRGDYTASEDDNVLVQGVANDPDALGYFGYAYYEENRNQLKLIKVDGEKGGGCVEPNPQTIASGTYVPLSRPIFIYAKLASLIEKPAVREFVRYYVDPKNATEYIAQVGYIPFPEQYYGQALQRVNAAQVGTVFPGGSQLGVKIEDLFGRTPSMP